MSDKEFWVAIRAALLAMVAAIERRYLGQKPHIIEADKDDTASYSIS